MQKDILNLNNGKMKIDPTNEKTFNILSDFFYQNGRFEGRLTRKQAVSDGWSSAETDQAGVEISQYRDQESGRVRR